MLEEKDDVLLWSWNTSDGSLIEKLSYEAIFSGENCTSHKWWYISLWKWNLPLKKKYLVDLC